MTDRAPSAAGLGEYPRRYDVAALPLRRQRSATRFLAWTGSLAAAANCALVGAAIALAPLKSGEPSIAVRGINDVYAAGAPETYIDGGRAYVEKMAVHYVQARNTLTRDEREMARIWGDDGFLRQVEDDDAIEGATAFNKDWLDDLAKRLKGGQTLEAKLVESRELIAGEVFAVDLNLIARDAAGKTIEIRPIRATVQVAFDPAVGATLENPLGFMVAAYSQEARSVR